MTKKIVSILKTHTIQNSIVIWIVLGFIIFAIALWQLFSGIVKCQEQKHSLDERYLYKNFAIKMLYAIFVMAIPTVLIIISVMCNN